MVRVLYSVAVLISLMPEFAKARVAEASIKSGKYVITRLSKFNSSSASRTALHYCASVNKVLIKGGDACGWVGTR